MFLNIVAVVLLLCSAYVSKFAVEAFWPFSVLGLGFPYFLILNALFILGWLFVDVKNILVSIVAVVLVWSTAASFISFNFQEGSNAKGIKIMTYNISNGVFFRKDNSVSKTELSKVAKYIKNIEDLDVICIQEGSKNVVKVFEKYLTEYTPVYLKDRRAILFSRLPIEDMGLLDFDQKVNSTTWADVKVGNTTVRIYNMHLASNTLTRTANDVISKSDLQEKQTWGKIKRLFSKYKQGSKSRREQVNTILKHAKKSTHPVIICGDMNDVPTSHTYTMFSQEYRDAFVIKGFGVGTTFRGSIPFLKIDYMMVGKGVTPLGYKIERVIYSDHYPSIATFSVAR